ncbi:MAG: hypothetical protein WD928_08395 [Gammaproteobacteria bacterium]
MGEALRVVSFTALLAAAVTAGASSDPNDAARFVEFESVPDGRCQILSDGGKLRILRNTHGAHAINYRVERIFAGSHRQGLADGIAPAGGEAVKLGCTRVDGREQDWILDRARFE